MSTRSRHKPHRLAGRLSPAARSFLGLPMVCSDCGREMASIDPELVQQLHPELLALVLDNTDALAGKVAASAFMCECGNVGLRSSGEWS